MVYGTGLTHAEVQVVGRRLTDHLQQTFVSESNRLTLEPDVRSNLVGYGDRTDCTFWDLPYHPLAMGGRFTFTVSCEEPIKASVDTTPIVGVANDVQSPFAFIVIDANRSSILPLKLRVTDLHPALSTFAETRIDSWVKQAISAAIRELQRALDSALPTHGYSA